MVVVPDLGIKRKRDHDPDGAGLTGGCDLEGLEDRLGDLGLMADFDQCFYYRAKDGGIGEAVNLADLCMRGAIDISDQGDDRDAVVECFADAGERVGETRARHDGEDTGGAGGPRRGVGHDAGGSFMGYQKVWYAFGFQGVPEFVVLGAWDSEEAAHALATEGGGRGLCPGHLAVNAFTPGIAAELDT